jgi:hypothetical protein
MHVYYLFLVCCIVRNIGIKTAANTINVSDFKIFSLMLPSTTSFSVLLHG